MRGLGEQGDFQQSIQNRSSRTAAGKSLEDSDCSDADSTTWLHENHGLGHLLLIQAGEAGHRLLGPVIGAAVIKYFENIFSSFNDGILMEAFSFLPEMLQHAMVSVTGLFVGEGWHLTLGALFMIIVIFLPGGRV